MSEIPRVQLTPPNQDLFDTVISNMTPAAIRLAMELSVYRTAIAENWIDDDLISDIAEEGYIEDDLRKGLSELLNSNLIERKLSNYDEDVVEILDIFKPFLVAMLKNIDTLSAG